MGSIETRVSSFNGQQLVNTSFYGVGGDGSLVHAIHLVWDSGLVATITFESCDLPPEEFAANTAGISGIWIQQQPPTGYTAISPPGAATVGASPLIINVPGGTAGGASVLIGTFASRRWRVKVVCTVTGQLRVHQNGKL